MIDSAPALAKHIESRLAEARRAYSTRSQVFPIPAGSAVHLRTAIAILSETGIEVKQTPSTHQSLVFVVASYLR